MIRPPRQRACARPFALVVCLLLAACAAVREPAPEAPPVPAWGDSRASVIQARPGEPVVAPAGRLVYHDELAGVPVTTTYRFDGSGLAERKHFNRGAYADENRYIADYKHLRDRLIERHGLPRIDERAWNNRLFAGEPERFGDAVAAGHLVYYCEWRTADARIVMALRGERLQVAHELVYTPLGE
jgi:hypothetical protein